MAQPPRNPLAWLLIVLAMTLVVLLLVLPLVLIFSKAFGAGLDVLLANLVDSDMQSAIRLTLWVAAITVPVNLVFGVALAWCVTRYDFRGRSLLLTVIDLPFAMSPVVAGLCYLVTYGITSPLGQWLSAHDIQVMFSPIGITLVTIFVTCPYVARILIPLMESQGSDEEQAALTLGAGGWQAFWHVTLPNIKWALLYGVVITNARAVGEFGAVSVVSGAVRGQTLTLPLHVELLHMDYNTVGAFTAAGLLACMALLTLVIKTLMEWHQQRSQRLAAASSDGDTA